MEWVDKLKIKYVEDKVRLSRFIGNNEKEADSYFNNVLKYLIDFNPDKIAFSLCDTDCFVYRFYKDNYKLYLSIIISN